MIGACVVLCGIAAGDDLSALESKLRSAEERERRVAVQELAKLDSKEAWSRVIGALADTSPQVADEAEIQLAKARAPETIAELCGKRGLLAKDPWVRAHAAGAVGSSEAGAAPSDMLLPALDDKSADAKRILCASIERLAAAGRISAAEKLVDPLRALAKRDEAETRGAAILALAALPRFDVAPFLAAAAPSDPAAVTCALARLASGRPEAAARQFVKACAPSPHRSVRAAVVESLSSAPDPEGLQMLVSMLEAEKNRRLAARIDAVLEKLSGLDGGGKPEFWRQWVDHLGPEWKPTTGGARPRAPAGGTAVARLAGLPIVSSALVILVDFSGSTWEKRADGTTRKERLDAELRKALEALPPDTLFNVIPYTATPIPWEKTVVPASAANVEKALKAFASCKATGKGNFWDAATLALEDPAVDTILVMTDGAPTGGHRWNIDLMRERYVERNRLRHVALDAVIVDAKKGLQDRWRAFAEATDGQFLAVDLN